MTGSDSSATAGAAAAPLEADSTLGAIDGVSDAGTDDGNYSDSLPPNTPPDDTLDQLQYYSNEERGMFCPDLSLHYMW